MFNRILLCVIIYCYYILIECESKKYLVKTKSKSLLVNMETDGEQKREHINGARKRKGYQSNKSLGKVGAGIGKCIGSI